MKNFNFLSNLKRNVSACRVYLSGMDRHWTGDGPVLGQLDSLSLVSRQSVLTILVVLLTAFSGNAWAQGTESFENLSNATDYKSRSWTGDNGRSWSATNARTDYKTKGSRGLTFKASTASTITMSITNDQKSAGIGVLSFKYYFPFSDSGKTRKLSITIGSNTYTTGDLSYTSSATSGSITINSALSSNTLTINIDNSGGRICVDEFSWTAKPSATKTFLFVNLKNLHETLRHFAVIYLSFSFALRSHYGRLCTMLGLLKI